MKFFTAKKKDDEKKDDHVKAETTVENGNKEKQKVKTPIKVDQTTQAEEIKKVESEKAEPQKENKKSEPIIEGKSIPSTEKIKKLVEIITSSDEEAINPVINFEKNRITYPLLTKIGENEDDVEYLEKISSNSTGILEREVYERLIVCPQHPQDLSVSVRMYCPNCSSMDIRKLHLIEHKVCGYIAEKDEYGIVSVNDIRTCPNCKRQIKDHKKEIRLPGQWNKCNSCNKKFDNPKIKLRCRRFYHDFDLDSVESIVIPRYRIKENAGENINILTLIPQLKKILNSLGFTVAELTSVKGKSGVSHQTDIFAQNNENKTIAVFIKTAKEVVEETEINSTLVSVLDINPTWTIFIGIPSVSERASAMASTHKMIVVTGKDLNQLISDVEKKISEEISLHQIKT